MSKSWPTNYTEIEALAAYINRIGAEQRTFRRFEIPGIKGRGHYKPWKGVVVVLDDGKIVPKGVAEELRPTEEEEAAVIKAYAAMKKRGIVPPHQREFGPSIAEAKRIELGVAPENWFVFLTKDRQNVRWCQERVEKISLEGGDYIPHSLWVNGGEESWEKMEWEGNGLTLWYPPLRRKEALDTGYRNICLHEGAKAARFITEMLLDKERAGAHPWGKELAAYEHFGWPGGAPNAHRVDWSELLSMNINELVIVADNDGPGHNAVRSVSRFLAGKKVYCVSFGGPNDRSIWPHGFDLADEWPTNEKLWVVDKRSGQTRYVGPSMDDLMTPASWATDRNEGGSAEKKKGRPKSEELYHLHQSFKDEWIYVEEQGILVPQRLPNTWYNKERFNDVVAAYSDVKDTASLVIKEIQCKVDSLGYIPGSPHFVVHGERKRFVNSWTASRVTAVKGDIKPFLDFMEHLIPNKEDRHQVLRWIATIVARPSIKMKFGLLLVSIAQGVGKGTLMEKILLPLVGSKNVSTVTESQLLKGDSFNEWRVNKTLVLCHEIYSGHSRAAYYRLNDIITETSFRANEKFLRTYDAVSWNHVCASSNSMQALNVPEEDRRWLIPSITENPRTADYWVSLNRWLTIEDGLGIIKWWAERFDHFVGEGERAPITDMKKRVIEGSMSDWQIICREFMDGVKQRWMDSDNKGRTGEPIPIVIHDRDTIDMIITRLKNEADGPRTFIPSRVAILNELMRGAFPFFVSGFEKNVGVRKRRLTLGCPVCVTNPESVRENTASNWRCEGCGRIESRSPLVAAGWSKVT